MQIPIRRTIERVPGGMMVVPLWLGALVHTCAPHAAGFFGSFTAALFEGALPILAVFYVCIGSTIPVKSLPRMFRRGGALLGTKVALGFFAGIVLGRFLGAGPVRAGWFAGVSTLAVVAAINDTNGGLYMALMDQYGRPEDAAAYSVMALESGPFLTMVTLGVAGLASFPWQTLLGAILPLALGMLLGNLDADLRNFLGHAAPVMIPFFAFALGATLNLRQVWAAGLVGIGLGIAVLLISACALGLVDRVIGGTGTAGIAAATTAGNAAAVPALIAAADHHYAAAAAPATVLVASSVMVTTILAPALTAWWDLRTRSISSKPTNRRCRSLLVIADDLTGAADTAMACASCGLEAVVLLDDKFPPEATVLAIDANTRCGTPEQAAAEMKRLAARDSSPDQILFKKVDSTLRGHLAVELAALLEARRQSSRVRVVALLAPSFPAHGRTTLHGQLLVHGVPLEQTDLWQRERVKPPSSIPEILSAAGLRSRVIELETVRSEAANLEHALEQNARNTDVLVCDAATDADLATLTAASMQLSGEVIWAGSAGLACHLPHAAGWPTTQTPPPADNLAHGPALILVGSMSRVSHDQTEALAASADLLTLRIALSSLLAGTHSAALHAQRHDMLSALSGARDVLVLLDGDLLLEQEHGPLLTHALARFVAGAADSAGALVASGGETARAVLEVWGISRLRLRGEVEPGLPFSVAEGWRRPLPILTKAGGFGKPETLLRCREFLHQLERGATATSRTGA